MLKIVLADISFVSVERTTSMPNPLRMSNARRQRKDLTRAQCASVERSALYKV